MKVTEEVLQKELDQLIKQREQSVAQFNQVAGAIAITESLIKKLKEPEPKVEIKKDK